MNMYRSHIMAVLLIMASVLPVTVVQSAHAAELVVIAHPDNAIELSREEIYRIYHGKSSSFPDGSKALPVILNDNTDAHAVFTSKVLNRTASQFKSYWAKKLFTGKGKPPKAVNSVEAMKALIEQDPNYIGYLLLDSLDDNALAAGGSDTVINTVYSLNIEP